MLFPDKPDRICLVRRMGEDIIVTFFEPTGQAGAMVFKVPDVKELIARLNAVCPELENKDVEG